MTAEITRRQFFRRVFTGAAASLSAPFGPGRLFDVHLHAHVLPHVSKTT